jgi:predicted Zn-dependent peptidase
MLSEGAGDKDAIGFNDALQSIGATFGAGADHETIGASMTVLKRNLDKGLGLFGDALRRPRFAEKDWERVKRLTIDELNQMEDNPRSVAGVVANRLLYGESNPYSRPSAGVVASIQDLEVQHARRRYQALVDPADCFVLVTGDISPEEAKAALNRVLGDWKSNPPDDAGEAPAAADFSIPSAGAMRLAIVDRPNATQTVIHFATPGVPFRDKARVERRLLNTILGGSFTSRLNQNLREDHGYTYGARSRWSMDISTGDFSAAASVQAQATGAALKEFFNEFQRLKSGDISDAETTKAKETLRQDMISDFEGLGGLLGVASRYLSSKLGFEAIAQDMEAITRVNTQQLNQLAKAAVALDDGVLVLVGDRALILEQIKDLNLPAPLDLTPTGAAASPR